MFANFSLDMHGNLTFLIWIGGESLLLESRMLVTIRILSIGSILMTIDLLLGQAIFCSVYLAVLELVNGKIRKHCLISE